LRTIQLIHYVQLLAKLRLAESRNQKPDATVPQNGSGAGVPPDITVDNMIYLEPRDEVWRDAWQVTEDLIKEVRDEVKQKEAKFLLVTVSNPIQVYPNPAARQRFLQYIGANDLFYPNLRLKALADREQIDFLDLAEPMQAYADQNKVFLHGFKNDLGNGHWNVNGHRVAAELIAQHFCRSR
jgi:hypothetical protein